MATTRGISQSRLGDQFDFMWVQSQNLLPLLQKQFVDLVIFRNPNAWHRAVNLGLMRLYGQRFIIHEHHYSAGFEQFNVPSVERFRTMLKLCYQLADRVVAISEAQSAWMQSHHLLSPAKLSLIRQCPEIAPLVQMPPKPLERPLVMGAYGRFSRQKGFDTLLKALPLIPDCPVVLHLGGYGDDAQQLEELAQRQARVKFWGRVDNLPEFLAACDVVVIPSRWEPWGNVAVEVKAAGKPIIASSVDGLSEQVQGCGLLVPPDDPVALATAIDAIAALPAEKLQSWGRAARASVEQAWEIYLSQWEALLWQTLDR